MTHNKNMRHPVSIHIKKKHKTKSLVLQSFILITNNKNLFQSSCLGRFTAELSFGQNVVILRTLNNFCNIGKCIFVEGIKSVYNSPSLLLFSPFTTFCVLLQ